MTLSFNDLLIPAERIPVDSLKRATNELNIVNKHSTIVRYGCGHSYQYRFDVNLFGRTYTREQQWTRRKIFCGNCLLGKVHELFRRCSLCGHVIIPGQSISFSPGGITPFCDKPWDARLSHRGNDLGFIACTHPLCMANARAVSGYWNEFGFRPLHFGESKVVQPCESSLFVL